MYPYRPYPWHQLLPVMILLVTALLTGVFPSGYMVIAFIVIAIICVVTSIWIAVAGTLEKYTEYWSEVGYDIDRLRKSPPELWGALGFVAPPQKVTVTQNMTGEPGESTYLALKNFEISLSPERLQILADALLTGAKTLAEGDWRDTEIGQTKIREIKHQMIRAGLAAYRNPSNRLSGVDLTERGMAWLLQYASAWVQEDPRVGVVRVSPHPPSRDSDLVQL